MKEVLQMLGLGGRKSRNKVIVGEPAIGSLILLLKRVFSVLTNFNYFLK
jgi:hypothetical protein